MAILTSKQTFSYTTPIASKTLDKASAIRLLQSPDKFLRCNPHFVKYETSATPLSAAEVQTASAPPAPIETKTGTGTVPSPRVYDVSHHVPNPVYSADIVSREISIDCVDGIWVRTQSPMGIVMETHWCVRERGETTTGALVDGDGEEEKEDDEAAPRLEFVQQGHFTCNKVLSAIVRRQTDAAVPEIHRSVIRAMEEMTAAAAVA